MYGDSDDENADGDAQGYQEEVEYVAETSGRSLGEQPIPRYVLSKIRPFEVMFADNKDCPCTVRGGKQCALVLVNYYSRQNSRLMRTRRLKMEMHFKRS
jgi:hypothetical protein